jgi:HlyD family secretion protein
MNGKWLRRWPWFAAAAAAIGLAVWAFAPRPVEVDLAPVSRGAFEKTVDEDGRTRVRERYVISAPIAGRLLRVGLKAGDAVARDTLVATLLPAAPSLLDARAVEGLNERVGAAEADRARTAAEVERAQVALRLAQSELERGRSLAGQGFTSKQALERAEGDVELKSKELAAARFDSHAAEHQLALARAALLRARAGDRAGGERWDIRSPVAGRVLKVVQESETVVPVGAPLVEVGDPRNLEIFVDVLTADAVLIQPGAPVRLDRGAGTPPLAGRVRLIEPAAFTKVSALGVEEQRVNVVIDFTSPPQEWQDVGDAYRVDARIVVARQADAITVPTGAVFRHGAEWAVFVADGGRARLRVFEPGARGGPVTVVQRGLEPAEQVVVYPGDAVRDGVRIRARAAAAGTR